MAHKKTKNFWSVLFQVVTLTIFFAAFSPSAANAAGPSLQTAIVSMFGDRVTLTFDDLGGTTTPPTRTDFNLSGSSQGQISIVSVSKSETTIVVSASPGVVIMGNQTISLTYTPTTNIPANSANEPLAGFTTSVSHPAANNPITFEITVNSANLSQIRLENFTPRGIVCSLSTSNFVVKVNGSPRSLSSVSQTCSGSVITLNLSSPIVANDIATISYTPSSNSIKNYFGVAASAFSDSPVLGVPDTIFPTLTLPATSNYQFGQGGTIPLVSSEPVGWSVTTDLTLSFQITGDPAVLQVSSILPIGSYTVGLAAEDNAGNRTTRNITVTILAAGATPSPTPIVTTTPKQTTPGASKAVVYKNCLVLNRKYPGGVAMSFNSKNKGVGMSFIPRVDSVTYKANIKLDKDKDGIACER